MVESKRKKKDLGKRILKPIAAAIIPGEKERQEREDRPPPEPIQRPQKKPEVKAEPTPKPGPGGQVIKDTATGEVKRVLTAAEVENLSQINRKGGRPISENVRNRISELQGTNFEAQAGQQEALALFQQYQGQQLPPDVAASLSPTELDMYQALATGSFGAVTGALAGGVAGGAVGAIGAIPGIVGGITIGTVQGVRSNIGTQLSGLISGRQAELQRVQTNLVKSIRLANQGLDPSDSVNLFYSNVATAQKSHAQLKIDTDRNLAKFTGKSGTPELIKYELFFEETLPILEAQLQQAILNPNPNKVVGTIDEELQDVY